MTTLLTGSTHASRARSTSSTVRARSSGSSASKPRSPRTVGASRRLEPAAAVAVDLEQRPALGGQHLDGHRVGAAHRDGLLVAVDHVVEGLLEDVLVVGHRVGDRPGHLAGVREVLDAGHAREGEADDVERSSGSSQASRTWA